MNPLEELQNAKQKGYGIMIKYHNDMNLVAFKNFNQRELNIFFSICALMKEKGDNTITFSYNELKRLINTKLPTNQVFEDLLVSTYNKLLQLQLGYHNENKIVRFVLFTGYIVDKEKKEISIRVNHDYAYVLNDLSSNFTIFELQEFNTLASSYSKHMFRLLKQFKRTGYYSVSVDEFRRLLDIPKYYTMKRISDKILSVILKELSSYFVDLKVIKIKDGRTIKTLDFYFKPQHYTDNQVMTIDIKAENSHDLAASEKRKEEILCPKCGKPLALLTKKDGSTFWGHPDYNDHEGNCKQSYSTKEAIEIDREKKIKVLEAEQNRSSIEIEVKALINQHRDIVKLVEFGKEFLTIDQVNKEDLFQNTPLIKIKINSNTIAILKQCIDEWS